MNTSYVDSPEPVSFIENFVNIPVDKFISPNRNHPSTRGMITKEGGIIIFETIVEMLGFPSLRRLGNWIQVPDPNYVYRWSSGKQTVSQLYLTRMIYLVFLKTFKGINLNDIERINWSTGEQIINENQNNKTVVRPNLSGDDYEIKSEVAGSWQSNKRSASYIAIAKPPIF